MKLNNKRLGQVLAASLATAAVADTANATTNECMKIDGYPNAYTCDMTGIGDPIMYYTNSRVKTAIMEEYCGGSTSILGGYTEESRNKQQQATTFCNVQLDQTAPENGLSVTDETADTTPPELQSVSPVIGEELPEGTTSRLLIVGFDDPLTSASLQSLVGGTAGTVNIIDGNTVQIMIEGLQNGTEVTWSLEVTGEGGVATANGNFNVAQTPDRIPPKITVDPTDGTVFPAGTTQTPIVLETDEQATCNIDGVTTEDSTDGRTHTGEITGLQTGPNHYTRECTDPSGNRTEETGKLDVAEFIDPIPPALSGFSPADGKVVPFVGQTEEEFSFKTNKEADCYRNGEPMNTDADGLHHSIQIPVEAGGTYPNEVTCANANGYESAVTVTFSVEKQIEQWQKESRECFAPYGRGSTKEFCIKGDEQSVTLAAEPLREDGKCTSEYSVIIDGQVLGGNKLPFKIPFETLQGNTSAQIMRVVIECPSTTHKKGRKTTAKPENEKVFLELSGDGKKPTIKQGACPKKKVRR